MGFFDFVTQPVQTAIQNPLQTIGTFGTNLIPGVIQGLGGAVQQTAGAFTPTNQFAAQAGLGPDVAQQAEKQLGGLTGQQQDLATALLAQSQGQGPNLAAEQTRQALQQAQAQQAGAIASQKGISPALAARLASQGSAQMRAQAAGQAGLTQAQQQLGAQQALGGLYGQMAGQQLQNIGLVNQANLGAQQINAAIAAQNAAAQQQATSGLLGGLAAGTKSFFGSDGGTVPHFAQGGKVQHMANGGTASQNIAYQMAQNAGIPMYGSGMDFQSGMQAGQDIGSTLKKMKNAGGAQSQMMAGGPMDVGGASELAPMAMMAADGGKVPDHLMPIAQIYHNYAMGGATHHLKDQGGHVPGQAKVKGDSPKNDTVPAMLSPGEIVIPRSIVQSQKPEEKAADFVAKEIDKHGKYAKGGTVKDDFKKALQAAIAERRKK